MKKILIGAILVTVLTGCGPKVRQDTSSGARPAGSSHTSSVRADTGSGGTSMSYAAAGARHENARGTGRNARRSGADKDKIVIPPGTIAITGVSVGLVVVLVVIAVIL